MLLDWRKGHVIGDPRVVWDLYHKANKRVSMRQTQLEINVNLIDRDYAMERIPEEEYEFRLELARKHKYCHREVENGGYYKARF